MKSLWGPLCLLILSITLTHGQFFSMMHQGDSIEPAKTPEQNFFLSVLDALTQIPKKNDKKLPKYINEDENEIIPMEEKTQQTQEDKLESKYTDKFLSPPMMKTFIFPKDEIVLDVGMNNIPQPKPQIEDVKIETSSKEMKKDAFIFPNHNKHNSKFSIFDLLFPPVGMFGPKPKSFRSHENFQKDDNNKCFDVTCTPPPSLSTCEKAQVKPSQKLDGCCPLWLCTGPDGSFHTHYGMNRVNKKQENGGAQSSFFQQSSSSSQNVPMSPPRFSFPGLQMDLLNPLAMIQEKRPRPNPIFFEFTSDHDETPKIQSPWIKKHSQRVPMSRSLGTSPLDNLMLSMIEFPFPPSNTPVGGSSGPFLFNNLQSQPQNVMPPLWPFAVL